MSYKYIILLILVLTAVFSAYLLFSGSGQSEKLTGSEKKITNDFTSISADELRNMLKDKDFKLIDVHIPEQEHIPGTDEFIPFNEIEELKKALPNKNSKVVLYCRSGSMSKIASEELIKQGYTNIYELNGGIKEWIISGGEVMPLIN